MTNTGREWCRSSSSTKPWAANDTTRDTSHRNRDVHRSCLNTGTSLTLLLTQDSIGCERDARRFNCSLFDPHGFEQSGKRVSIEGQAAAMLRHVGDIVEGLEQAHLYCGILFGFAEPASVTRVVGLQYLRGEENAHGTSGLAIGADVEDILGCGSKRVLREGSTLADEVIFVNVAGLRCVGFQAADGHGGLLMRHCNPKGRGDRR